MRHRWAVPAFLGSLAGAIVGLGYQIARPAEVQGLDPTMNMAMPMIVIAIALGLFIYARAMRIRGVLD